MVWHSSRFNRIAFIGTCIALCVVLSFLESKPDKLDLVPAYYFNDVWLIPTVARNHPYFSVNTFVREATVRLREEAGKINIPTYTAIEPATITQELIKSHNTTFVKTRFLTKSSPKDVIEFYVNSLSRAHWRIETATNPRGFFAYKHIAPLYPKQTSTNSAVEAEELTPYQLPRYARLCDFAGGHN